MTTPDDRFVVEPDNDLVEHWDAVPWWEAPLPSAAHQCVAWTRGKVNGEVFERCACGGCRPMGGTDWTWRNERKRR